MEMDAATIDRVRGVIFGNACGDALGRAMEFMSKKEVKRVYPKGVSSYRDIDMKDGFRSIWKRGEWTDDTNQMICILDSILEKKAIVPVNIVQKFLEWAHNDGRGMGGNTRTVFSHKLFRTDPLAASEYVWNKGGRTSAPNGGVMRTSVLGLFDYKNKKNVIENAKTVCKITHFDPRCVASCVTVCLTISQMINGATYPFNVVKSIINDAAEFDAGVEAVMDLAQGCTIGDLHLDSNTDMGYTYKTLAAGLYAFFHADSFRDGILDVIHEGGDSDTNGAVAGALLGARFGFSSIPIDWVTGLTRKAELFQKVDQLVELITERSSM